MAERRMFAKAIVDSDLFLGLPLTAQALYFHLGVRADDDGFVGNPKKIQRMIGCSDDDLKLLIIKEFIIPFESGVVVISHWKVNNYIRNDRYKPTFYSKEKAILNSNENEVYTIGIPTDNQRDTQYRLGKVSLELGKDIPPISPTGIESEKSDNQQISLISESLEVKTALGAESNSSVNHSKTIIKQRFDDFWKAYPKKQGKGAAEKAFMKIAPTKELLKAMLKVISEWKLSKQWTKDNGQYIPNPATWLNQKRWEDEISTNSYGYSTQSVANDREDDFMALIEKKEKGLL